MLHWAVILAVCPEIHELVHPDAANEHHECAVTAVLSAGIEYTAVPQILLRVGVPFLEFTDASRESERLPSFFLSRRVLEHAPPLKG